ncbi:LTA synthase family protein [Paraburkholderia panacisoli]|uniref:LTA synthase family protein n=1 Tax=Paraburkholderia panacisoli TaxID=2603818 RepID=A0A5B0GZ44_9BURK|nr:LTA synthase family protein [Paraburkholderia panacisoli]KAA1008216.1 LTA synthase family protein [Paraburkholderia panacisoli]
MPYWPVVAAAAVALSFAVDAVPTPRASYRPAAAVSLHLAAVAVLGGCGIAITARPFFSIGVAIVLIALLAVVSNAKFESLREPFVFTDLSLFSQVFSHPRLYLPFLSLGKTLVIVIGVAIAVTGFFIENPIGVHVRAMAALVAAGCLAICFALSNRVPLTLDPMEDQRRCGFFAVFVAYLINGFRRAERRAFARAVAHGPFASGQPGTRADVIVVQSESYFDARRLSAHVLPDSYANFDKARREAFEHGVLTVPAWGANTMRSEFAMLTGLPSTALGYARFYPYMFVRSACASIAGWFKRGGYRTLAIHPYYASFFGRDRAFRQMRFDRFIDIRDFGEAARVGPYVGDAAVADAIIAELRRSDDKPVFALAITMENHGPLHLESVASGESTSRHTLGDDSRWRDLTAYLRHVENADRMIGKLTDFLRERARPTVLCFYGDHVPALPRVFDALGATPATSDYFIWRNFGERFGEQQGIHVENLGFAIQRAMTQKSVGIRVESQSEDAAHAEY